MTKTQRFTLVATGLGLFMIFLDSLIVNVALPSIQTDFKSDQPLMKHLVVEVTASDVTSTTAPARDSAA